MWHKFVSGCNVEGATFMASWCGPWYMCFMLLFSYAIEGPLHTRKLRCETFSVCVFGSVCHSSNHTHPKGVRQCRFKVCDRDHSESHRTFVQSSTRITWPAIHACISFTRLLTFIQVGTFQFVLSMMLMMMAVTPQVWKAALGDENRNDVINGNNMHLVVFCGIQCEETKYFILYLYFWIKAVKT